MALIEVRIPFFPSAHMFLKSKGSKYNYNSPEFGVFLSMPRTFISHPLLSSASFYFPHKSLNNRFGFSLPFEVHRKSLGHEALVGLLQERPSVYNNFG